MNILVIEDLASVAFYLTEALQAEGHVVLEAYNINDAKAHWDNLYDHTNQLHDR